MASPSPRTTEPSASAPVSIRLAVATDAQVLHDVAAESFHLACPPWSTEEDIAAFVAAHLSVESFRGYLADSSRALLLVESDGRGIGYSMLIAEEPSDPDVAGSVRFRPTVEVSKFYVLPSSHGQGVAAKLMSATAEEARRRGAASMWLGVNEENPRANRFYEKHGFEKVGVKRFLLGENWENDYVRECTLTPKRD